MDSLFIQSLLDGYRSEPGTIYTLTLMDPDNEVLAHSQFSTFPEAYGFVVDFMRDFPGRKVEKIDANYYDARTFHITGGYRIILNPVSVTVL